jgi:hypothetical protein
MTDLPYIFAAYGVFAVFAVALAIFASLRLGRAKSKLLALDKRAAKKPELP